MKKVPFHICCTFTSLTVPPIILKVTYRAEDKYNDVAIESLKKINLKHIKDLTQDRNKFQNCFYSIIVQFICMFSITSN